MEIMNLIGQGMGVDQDRLTAIAVNLANVRTPAYKRELVNGAAFETQMDALERRSAGAGTPSPSATYSDMRPGAVRYTGRPLDVALTGETAFIELSRDGKTLYGRQGSLHVDSQGRLATAGGDLVMGQGGEIRLTSTAPRIDPMGNVYDQGRFVDKLSLASFTDPQGLTRLGGGRLRGVARPCTTGARRRIVGAARLSGRLERGSGARDGRHDRRHAPL